MAHPQHNFTSNFNGSDGHNAELTLNINGVEKKYTPAGNDQTYNVPGVARIDINLDGADLVQAIQTALDGAAQPVLVEMSIYDEEYVYQYIGDIDGRWYFGTCTTNKIVTITVAKEDGAVNGEQIPVANGVVIVPSDGLNVYSQLRTAIALGQLPVLSYVGANPVYAQYEKTADNGDLIFVGALATASNTYVQYNIYTVHDNNTVTVTTRAASAGGGGTPDDENGFFNSSLYQTPGDGVTESLTLNDFRIKQGTSIHGSNIEFVVTHTEGGIDFGEVWLNPGTYILNIRYTLQWVGNPRGTFIPLVCNVGGQPFDFSFEQENTLITSQIRVVTARQKVSIAFPFDADTPSMGIWVETLSIAQLASNTHPAVVHDTTLAGSGTASSPLGVTTDAFGKVKDIPTSISQFRTGDVIPVDGPNGPARMPTSNLQDAILGGPIDEAVQNWLDEHPEATTTVQDGSLTELKFSDALKLQTIKDYVTPEMFGAKGDGVTDDTSAFVAAAATGKIIIGIASRYAIGGRFTSTNSVLNLNLVALATDAGFAVANTNNVSIENVDFDYNGQVCTQCIEAQNVKNLSVRNLKLYGAGSNTGSMIFGFRLREKCDNVLFENCEFSDFNGAVGGEIGFIVISNNGNAGDINKHIKIIGCTFSEIGPSDDADAVKVISGLNDDRDCFLLVSGCTFKNCRKRAMKFQGNECISSNNVIIVNKPMFTAIDFQRSRCSSFNDRIILDYDGVTQVDYYGLLNHGFSICGDDCVIRGLKVECRNTIAYTEGQYSVSRIFDFGSLNGKTEINNTSITDCEIGGFGCVLYADNILEKINNLFIDNLVNVTPDPDTAYYRAMLVGNVKFDRLTIRGKFFGKYQVFLTTNVNNDFTNCFIDIYGYIEAGYFRNSDSNTVRIRTSAPESTCWVRGFDFERGTLTLYMRGTSILDNAPYTSHKMAFGTPVGTRVKFKNGAVSGTDVYNEAICYEAGTSTTTGKYKNILVSTT